MNLGGITLFDIGLSTGGNASLKHLFHSHHQKYLWVWESHRENSLGKKRKRKIKNEEEEEEEEENR